MIVDAAEIGLHGSAFWDLAPYELSLQFKGARQRMDGWYELGLFVAWHAALFQRAKTLPDLAPLLKKIRATTDTTKAPEPAQTWQEQKGIMAAVRSLLVNAPPAKPKARTDPPKKGKR